MRRRDFFRVGAASMFGAELASEGELSGKSTGRGAGPRAVAQAPGDDGRGNVNSCEWLLEPFNTTVSSSALVKSLGDAAGYVVRWQPPASAEAWRKRRPVVEAAFRKAIGLAELPGRTPLQPRVMARHDLGGYTLENVLFESRPDHPVSANIYRSKSVGKGKRPAILCPIGHYLHAGKAATDVQARCIKLAQMGFTVLTYDAVGQGERLCPGNIHHEAGYALLPLGETIAGWMVWDSMRAIDYLLTLEEVDASRIGVTGNSGGGLNTLFTSALETRVQSAVIVGFTFEFNNWLKYGGTHCTCTHLPGMFRAFEWFEVAGLIAPRALMMLHGDRDGIFPISGARRAGHNTEAIYALLGESRRARFCELANQPHAYSQPYRETMYGWMAHHLLGQGNGEPIPEGQLAPLAEDDLRLRCDRDGSVFAHALSVVDLAREKSLDAITRMNVSEARESARHWVQELVQPPESRPHHLAPDYGKPIGVRGGRQESFSFSSEDGAYIPGWLWTPETGRGAPRTVLIVDDRGIGAVVESGLVEALLAAGYNVVSVDLRGRGETLGYFGPHWNINFRLLANQIEFGRPLAGRRAYDLRRTVDFLALRPELASHDLTLVGLGDEALPALLAAAADGRIQRVAMAGYFHSLISQMRARPPRPEPEMSDSWNDPQSTGRLNTGDYEIDFGSVIPSALGNADLPDIACLVAPRRLLFCQARDANAPGSDSLITRFRQVTGTVGGDWIRYAPAQELDGQTLQRWLQERGGR